MTIFIMRIPYHSYITKPLIVIITLGSESNLKIIICYAKMDEFLYDSVSRTKPFIIFWQDLYQYWPNLSQNFKN